MSKVLEVRRTIQDALKAVHPRVWFERAPDDAPFPYLVFHLEAITDPSLERFLLDVDGWDAPADGSTVALEELMERVDQALHKRVICLQPSGGFVSPFQFVPSDDRDSLAFAIYRDRRLWPEDDDPRIRRRMYSYEVRTFERRRDYHGT